MPILPPAAMNPNSRGHWTAKSKAAAEFRDAVRLYCISERNLIKGWVPFSRPVIDLTFIYASLRDRDEDNARAAFKPGLDGIVDAELLLGDSPKSLITGKITMVVDKKRAPSTIIELREGGE